MTISRDHPMRRLNWELTFWKKALKDTKKDVAYVYMGIIIGLTLARNIQQETEDAKRT